MNVKNKKLDYVLLVEYQNVYGFMKCKCKGWILRLLRLWAPGSNYLYLCGNTFGNVIQLEPEPSTQKAAELEYKIHTI